MVRQSVSICEHLVERGGITLGIEVDPELPVVQAIGGQLEQVLINLITNAVHAAEGHGDGARVAVRAKKGGADAVVLSPPEATVPRINDRDGPSAGPEGDDVGSRRR